MYNFYLLITSKVYQIKILSLCDLISIVKEVLIILDVRFFLSSGFPKHIKDSKSIIEIEAELKSFENIGCSCLISH